MMNWIIDYSKQLVLPLCTFLCSILLGCGIFSTSEEVNAGALKLNINMMKQASSRLSGSVRLNATIN